MSNPTPEPGSSDRLEADAAARDSVTGEQPADDAATSAVETDAAAPVDAPPAALPAAAPVIVPETHQAPVADPAPAVDTATTQFTPAEQTAAQYNPAQQAPAQYVPAQQAWSEPAIAQPPVEQFAPASAPAEEFESHPYPAAAYVPVAEQTAAPLAQQFAPAQQQFPLYVQAPEQPKDRGNRGFGILIGLLGTVVFGAIYAAAVSGLALAFGGGAGVGRSNDFVEILTTLVTSWVFIGPVIAFFLAWIIASVIINRAGWVHWVLGGVLIGLVTYLAWFGGLLLEQRAWTLGGTATLRLLLDNAFAFGPVVAFVVAREIPVWLGGWIASHGRKVRAENIEAQREYEQVLEAGPTVAS
ncbi:hypothetical protein ACL9RL_03105 [Plantibacter sp. Mn2098]|uniref:hypothetical protein n=1 Tax=Plantibacter sp. Mn2098 TaxID=3395266 RepID=UPI003BD47159